MRKGYPKWASISERRDDRQLPGQEEPSDQASFAEPKVQLQLNPPLDEEDLQGLSSPVRRFPEEARALQNQRGLQLQRLESRCLL